MVRITSAFNLCHLERYAEAEALLPQIWVLTAQLGNALDTLRLHWLEGRVSAGLGRAEEALAAFTQARAGFAEQSIAYDTALVTLELGWSTQQGRARNLLRLARKWLRLLARGCTAKPWRSRSSATRPKRRLSRSRWRAASSATSTTRSITPSCASRLQSEGSGRSEAAPAQKED